VDEIEDNVKDNTMHNETNDWMSVVASESSKGVVPDKIVDLDKRYDVVYEKVCGIINSEYDEQGNRKNLRNVAAWLILNFCPPRQRIHHLVETKHFRLCLNKKGTGETYCIQQKHYNRFSTYRLTPEGLVGLVREMLVGGEYVNHEYYNKLQTLYDILFIYGLGDIVARGSAPSRFDYIIERIGSEQAGIKLSYGDFIVRLRASFKPDKYRLSVETKIDGRTVLSSDTNGGKVLMFEYEGKEYDVREVYEKIDAKMRSYRSMCIALIMDVFINHMNDNTAFTSRSYSDDVDCYLFDYHKVANIVYKKILIGKEMRELIGKAEVWVDDIIGRAKFLEEIGGCDMLLNVK